MLNRTEIVWVLGCLFCVFLGSLIGWRAAQQKYRGDQPEVFFYQDIGDWNCTSSSPSADFGDLLVSVELADENKELLGQKFRWRGMYEECARNDVDCDMACDGIDHQARVSVSLGYGLFHDCLCND